MARGGWLPEPDRPRSPASSPAPRAQIVVTFPVKCLVIFRSNFRRMCSCCSPSCFPSPGWRHWQLSGLGGGGWRPHLPPVLPQPSCGLTLVRGRVRVPLLSSLCLPPCFLSLPPFSPGAKEGVFSSPEASRGSVAPPGRPTCAVRLHLAPSCGEKLPPCSAGPAFAESGLFL